jgi:hypothetical protein
MFQKRAISILGTIRSEVTKLAFNQNNVLVFDSNCV